MTALTTKSAIERAFSPDHEPARVIPRGSKRGAVPGIFPTRKAFMFFVRTRMPLMHDGLIHLDTDPDVRVISEYPVKLAYWPDSSGIAAQVFHLFDIGIEYQDGYRTFIDYVPAAVQLENRRIAARTARLRHVLQRDFGIGYAVHDENCLHIQPRFSNLKMMWRHQRARDPAAYARVRQALELMDLPATIADVKARTCLPPLVHEIFDDNDEVCQRTVLRDVDRELTAIMQLAMDGFIDVDLSRPFSGRTTITRKFMEV